jgi:three-Cys-motif partner protein
VDERKPRSWNFWTERKLAILEQYLPAFTTASCRQSPERIYIDAFAGEGSGTSRTTGEEFDASARLALQTQPPFTRLIFCERPRTAKQLREKLQRDFPGRLSDFEVLTDCNVAIPNVLKQLRADGLYWAATFAFIDPYGMEVAFSTLRALADFKRGYRHPGSPKPEFKAEIWLYFPSTAIERSVAADDRRGIPPPQRLATRVFGTDQWDVIHQLRARQLLSAERAREEYVNLMRWQLEHVLGYRWTHPLQVNDLRNRPVYHMILATDNQAGNDIMSGIYRKITNENPEMYEFARQQQSGQFSLPLEGLPSFTTEGYERPPTLPPLQSDGSRSTGD